MDRSYVSCLGHVQYLACFKLPGTIPLGLPQIAAAISCHGINLTCSPECSSNGEQAVGVRPGSAPVFSLLGLFLVWHTEPPCVKNVNKSVFRYLHTRLLGNDAGPLSIWINLNKGYSLSLWVWVWVWVLQNTQGYSLAYSVLFWYGALNAQTVAPKKCPKKAPLPLLISCFLQ